MDTGLGVFKFGPAIDRLDLGGLEKLRHPAGQFGHDGVFPGDEAGHVELGRFGQRDAELALTGVFGHVLEHAGGMDEGLGRDAAAIEAGAAQPVLVDNDGIQTQLAGADGGRIAARATTDDEDFAATFLHDVRLRLEWVLLRAGLDGVGAKKKARTRNAVMH